MGTTDAHAVSPPLDDAEEGALALADGTMIPFRPIRPTDLRALQGFHGTLSDRSVYRRFFGIVPELSEERARYFTHLDGTNRFALVALDPAQPDAIIAVVRFDRHADTDRAEYAAVVGDAWQGHGLGRALTWRLIAAARRRGIQRLYALVLPDNAPMFHLFRDLHLPEQRSWEDGSVCVEITLSPSA